MVRAVPGTGGHAVHPGEAVSVAGDTAWVTVDENLIAGAIGGTVSAFNLFVRTDGSWRMVAHHGSGVAASGA